MTFRKAKLNEGKEILALYHSVLGSEFTTWSEEYPSMETIEGDCAAGTLYVMEEGGKIIGAISIEPENMLDELPCWQYRSGAREVGRVVVAEAYRGRGIARKMLGEVEKIFQQSGCRAVHLLVACQNKPAIRTYEKAGYKFYDKHDLYGHTFYACEKMLG